MKPGFYFLILMLCTSAFGQISTTLGKTPAYFHKLYGAPTAQKELSEDKFSSAETTGAGAIKGPFAYKTYKSGTLRIHVHFAIPKLEAVHVDYSLPHAWTQEQVDAALSAYGTEWKKTKASIFPYYVSDSGDGAYHQAAILRFYSKGLREAMLASAKQREAERKAVPKF